MSQKDKKDKQPYKLKEILYSADVIQMLRISDSTLKRLEKHGLPHYRNDVSNRKMYIESEVVSWMLDKK